MVKSPPPTHTSFNGVHGYKNRVFKKEETKENQLLNLDI